MNVLIQLGSLFVSLVKPLVLTLAVEIPLGLFLVREKTYIKTFLLMNIMTNPLLNLLLRLFVIYYSIPYTVCVVFLEAAVWIGEAYIIYNIHPVSAKRAFYLSCVLNFGSYMAGVALHI